MSSWLHKPMIFFGRRLHFLFAAALSVPVWLAANTYIDRLPVSEDEAVSTAITMCFFTGVFTGRYIADVWKLHALVQPRRIVIFLAVFVLGCFCWLFIHADNPSHGFFVNLLLYLLPFLALSVGAGMLIKVVRALAEERLSDARNAAAQSESELKLLQSQLSPHFLFNTLNNLYGLSLTQHEKIPPLLLRLSDLLRHTVYGVNETFVSLKDETAYLINYIEFEKIRLGQRLVLQTDIDSPSTDRHKIAPMLLIVFVENAFKHAKNTTDDIITISIKLKTWNDLVLFSVENPHNKQAKQFDKNSGFGLNNVRKRLDLLYPDAYQLDIKETDRTYFVTLQLKTK